MRPKLLLCLAIVAATVSMPNDAVAQQTTPANCMQWKKYTDTVWVEQDLTENRLVTETSYETKEVTKSRPRWISEEHERTITEEKPVEQTRDKVVTRTVRKPVTTTKTRLRTRVEETFEEVTKMREETYTVRKPVTETILEKKEVRVRKPVTQRSVEKENVTLYRPQESVETQYVPGTLLVPGASNSERPRMRWLQRGYYGDPRTGQTEWRRGGLHWVDEPSQASVPVVVPTQRSTVTMVPETVVREKPVERITYVDEVETREVPVEVKRVVEETRTRKVPYTVRVPKRKVIEEEIPYTETTYVDETITERIPVTETVMKRVTRTEPVTKIRETWEDYTETVRVPKTITKRTPYVAKYRVPYLVEIRVPCDANGRPVARGQEIPGTHRLHPGWRNMVTKVVAGTKKSVGGEKSTAEEAEETSVLVERSASETKADLGPAPKDIQFPEDTNDSSREVTTRLKPIVRAAVEEPVAAAPRETEPSIELNKRIHERFNNLGFEEPEPEVSAQSVETIETSAIESSPVENEAPRKAAFVPEALSFEVEVPPDAQPPVNPAAMPSVEDPSDATIEHDDIDLSHPRS